MIRWWVCSGCDVLARNSELPVVGDYLAYTRRQVVSFFPSDLLRSLRADQATVDMVLSEIDAIIPGGHLDRPTLREALYEFLSTVHGLG